VSIFSPPEGHFPAVMDQLMRDAGRFAH
jgi:hypothetical protein